MAEIANMNRKISFEVPTTVKTAMGAPQKGFVFSFYAWASRKQIGTGNEQYVNDRLISPYGYSYRTHYRNRSWINETMRIVDDGIVYNILSINPDELKMFIDIIVEKITE